MRFSFMCVRAGVKPVSIHCPEYAYLSPQWERIVQVENCICSAFRTILIKRLDLRLLCQTARALLLFTYMMYWCKFRSDEAFSIDAITVFMNKVYQFILFSTSHFVKQMLTPHFTSFVYKYTCIRLELCSHNNGFLSQYLS